MHHQSRRKRRRLLNLARIKKCQKRKWPYFWILRGVFWHYLIWAKLSELGYFRQFPTNLIWCKLTWVGKVSHYHVAKPFPSSSNIFCDLLTILKPCFLQSAVPVQCSKNSWSIICTVECTVLFSLAQAHFANQTIQSKIHIQWLE